PYFTFQIKSFSLLFIFKFLKIKIKGFNMQMQEIIEAIGKELGINPDTFNLMNYLSINST
ncbi:hypothetical protein FM752_08745, partial [Campylobacter coli]|nr:hypothetical protein [Campylobacter coli]ECC0762579.1 hypothetical protein [Campylobacter coli]